MTHRGEVDSGSTTSQVPGFDNGLEKLDISRKLRLTSMKVIDIIQCLLLDLQLFFLMVQADLLTNKLKINKIIKG